MERRRSRDNSQGSQPISAESLNGAPIGAPSNAQTFVLTFLLLVILIAHAIFTQHLAAMATSHEMHSHATLLFNCTKLTLELNRFFSIVSVQIVFVSLAELAANFRSEDRQGMSEFYKTSQYYIFVTAARLCALQSAAVAILMEANVWWMHASLLLLVATAVGPAAWSFFCRILHRCIQPTHLIGPPTNEESFKMALLLLVTIILHMMFTQYLAAMIQPVLPSDPTFISKCTKLAFGLNNFSSAISLLFLLVILGELLTGIYRRSENRREINRSYKVWMLSVLIATAGLCLVESIAVAIMLEEKVHVWCMSFILGLIVMIRLGHAFLLFLHWMQRWIFPAPLFEPPTNVEIMKWAIQNFWMIIMFRIDIGEAAEKYSSKNMPPQSLSGFVYTFTKWVFTGSDLVNIGSLIFLFGVYIVVWLGSGGSVRRPVNLRLNTYIRWVFILNSSLFLCGWMALYLKHGVFKWKPVIKLVQKLF